MLLWRTGGESRRRSTGDRTIVSVGLDLDPDPDPNSIARIGSPTPVPPSSSSSLSPSSLPSHSSVKKKFGFITG
ncbi:hypothetical protein EJ110_NYTH27152 [Nymphaea thermarum]|nr:hypothetical protein EJ110_NYTH27152 [Nymphaea thermarum]